MSLALVSVLSIKGTTLLQAYCDFGPKHGSLLIREIAESGTGANTSRAVVFKGTIKNLCYKAPFILSIHENNNVECKCSEVGDEIG